MQNLLIFSFIIFSAVPVFSNGVLFLGKTGVGKTTLINVFYNHIVGKDYNAERDVVSPLLHAGQLLSVNVDRYKRTESLNADGHSQTDDVRSFVASGEMGTVELWDSPGFIDTRGIAQDVANIDRIAQAISDASFKAVAIVLDPSDFQRDTIESKAAFNMMLRFIPKNTLSNVIAVVNRSGALKNGDREYFKNKLSEMFGVAVDVYFVDGSSFFDRDDSQKYWERDRKVVSDIVKDLLQRESISGRKIRVPTALYGMMDKSIAGVKLADTRWEAFKEEVQKECILEFIMPGIYPLQERECFDVFQKGEKKFQKLREDFLFSFWMARARLNATAVSDKFEPYIAYIEQKTERIVAERSLDDVERERQVQEHVTWKKKFEVMEKGL